MIYVISGLLDTKNIETTIITGYLNRMFVQHYCGDTLFCSNTLFVTDFNNISIEEIEDGKVYSD